MTTSILAAAKGAPMLLATRSEGKVRELTALFATLGVRAVGLEEWGLPYEADEEEIEQFETFEENALAKAKYFYEVSGGIATMADDSGLSVVALDGRPGVRSKRWAGNDAANNAALVAALQGAADRRASYVCAAAYVGLGHEVVRRGEVDGAIVEAPRGSNGFGYDPYFFSPELGCTFGEASLEDKARVSHRARAFRMLIEALR